MPLVEAITISKIKNTYLAWVDSETDKNLTKKQVVGINDDGTLEEGNSDPYDRPPSDEEKLDKLISVIVEEVFKAIKNEALITVPPGAFLIGAASGVPSPAPVKCIVS